ncbi:hypothetical protein GCM10011326_45520 [Salipiger profundus]|nr:hypothetical protein GCM10011326_45520 [Salipiger profundus]
MSGKGSEADSGRAVRRTPSEPRRPSLPALSRHLPGRASLRRSFPTPDIGGIVQHVQATQGQQCGTKLPFNLASQNT